MSSQEAAELVRALLLAHAHLGLAPTSQVTSLPDLVSLFDATDSAGRVWSIAVADTTDLAVG
jgi:hypothetical protein